MPFANLWDVTFPPDTQLANLLGQDLRNFRLDAQQRMAAISGLDAAKPAFGADTQPANWNGILFFATDTGKIYQFNNPAWTDITSGFIKNNDIKILGTITNTGNTTLNTIYTAAVSPLVATGQLRVVLNLQFANITGNPTIGITFGGQTIQNLGLTPSYNGTYAKLALFGGNTGATNAQTWTVELLASLGVNNSETTGNPTTVDTTAGRNLIITCQNNQAVDVLTFNRFVLEYL